MATPHEEPPRETKNVREALRSAIRRLEEAGVPSSALAAELLLMHLLGRERAWIYSHPEAPLDAEAAGRYFALISRRAAGVPTQYLTGQQEFWGLEFEVTPAVLIPRPETEHVVEVALERLGPERLRGPLQLADAGTGSGCLAVALARELPQAEIFATDISSAALEVARRNAVRHGVADRIHFFPGNLLESLLKEPPAAGHETPGHPQPSRRLEAIVSNPPYVGRNEAKQLPREVREHEPSEALFAGERGDEIYGPLVHQAERLLRPGGLLVLEIGYGALGRVRELLEGQPAWARVRATPDLAGIPRVISAERAANQL